MKFRTELSSLSDWQGVVAHDTSVVTLGSCFSDTIAERLKRFKFHVLQNPFGTLFNPVSIRNAAFRIHSGDLYDFEEIISYKESFFSWDHHSSFDGVDRQKTLESINVQLRESHQFFKSASVFFITLGTAWVYKLMETDFVVANCHKVPSKYFDKTLLTVSEIEKSLTEIVSSINFLNPQAQIVFTISPVRHLKDGFVENNRAKARLITALHNVLDANTDCLYFPAYEYVVDDLRDYRFYDKDLLHPTDEAVDYVFEKFSETFFSKGTQSLNKRIEAVTRAYEHKPFNKESQEYKTFVLDTLKKIELISEDISGQSFEKERFYFEKELSILK